MKPIKAWAILFDDKLFPYVFSYTGEKVYMTFPTRHDALIFRGKEKWKIIKIEIKKS